MTRAWLISCIALGCGPGVLLTGDETGDESGESSSSESDPTLTDSSNTDSDSDSTDSDSDSTDTDSDSTDSDSTDSDDTGAPDPECPLAPDDHLWSLPCGSECAGLPNLWDEVFPVHAEGSQISNHFQDCGAYGFEGRVLDHPSPAVWIIDACPCDVECLEPDPHVIDFAFTTEHPAPELLPSELGECVHVDVWKSNAANLFETFCGPTAIALWSLDQPEPSLIYAQGNTATALWDQPVELGSLVVSHEARLCGGISEALFWALYSTHFALDDVSVVVPHQSLELLAHPSGDYEARNVASIFQGHLWTADIHLDALMWSVRPLR